MTETTIAMIAREKIVLDNTEWFEGEDGLGSFKSRIQSIRGTGVVNVTTSAVVTEVGPEPQLVIITTSGSGAGDDAIDVALPPVDGNGFNGERIGQQIILLLSALTDPGDVVRVTLGGNVGVVALQAAPYHSWTNVVLLSMGASIVFTWSGYNWCVDLDITPADSVRGILQPDDFLSHAPGGTDLGGAKYYIYGGDSTGAAAAGNAGVKGGRAFDSGAGGRVDVLGGDSGSGAGGSVFIDAGSGGTDGLIILGSNVPLPTADPHEAGALWNNGGALHISAG